MTGRLIAIIGPSGAGKDTLIAGALAARPDLIWARREITRATSAGGEPFEGIDVTEFFRRRDAGAFAFWWEAHGLFYGIPVTVFDQVAAGATVIFNASRAALPAIRDRCSEVEIIAITAPAEVLARRLAARGRETPADIRARLCRAEWPVPEGVAAVANDGTIEDGVRGLLAALCLTTEPHPNAELSGNRHANTP